MDKIKVNNQVVSMRKFVKQAKIHSINKCTKQIKFLENRKGTEEKMAKTKRKLQRLLEEVKILKNIKPDSVSKLALSKAKDWKRILAEKNVPLEDRCFAMLAYHQPVQESVEKFHSENSELISKIPELVKEWEEKKSRSSQINKKKQKGKQDNAKDPNKLPIGNKKNFRKSNEVHIKHENTESLENVPDSSDLKSIHNNVTEQNFKIKKITKRKKSSDSVTNNFDSSSNLCSPPKKKLLVGDDAKCNDSTDSLSDSPDVANNQDTEVKDKAQSGHSDQNDSDDSLSDSSYIANHRNSQNKKKLQVKDEAQSSDSDDCLSDSSEMANHLESQNEKLPNKDKTKNGLSFKNDSDDSLSDSSDIAYNQSSQANEKLPVNDETKSVQSCANSKQSKAHKIQKKMPLKKETMKSNNEKEIKVEINSGENSEKSPDIRSKLLGISMSKSKVQNKLNKKPSPVLHQLNAGVESDYDNEDSADANRKLNSNVNVSDTVTKPVKPEVISKMKAIAILDLDKLQDVDEIPIEKSDSDAEDETDEDLGKQKKDPFFLRDGQPVSESDEDESGEKEIAKNRDFPPFKKKPYGSFNKREQRDNSFQKRKFDKRSENGKNSNFREKGFVKNKEFSFKDNKRNFKQTSDDNSRYRQDKKNHFASKDKFGNRNGSNSFARNPKVKPFSKIHDRNEKRNSHPPKSNLSNSQNSIKPDDKPLHPSWEAKRKLKEAQKVVFKGKRMVF